MRYIFVSDIHGEYSKLIQALALEHFDAEKDTLVSLGDPFDRGTQSKEVLDFILSCPHRIIVLGNHDWRLKGLIEKPVLWSQYDIMNGVPETYRSFLGLPQDTEVSAWEALRALAKNEKLRQYYEEAVLYVEFKDIVAVHGWVPFNVVSRTLLAPYRHPVNPKLDWHHALRMDWYDATWAHTRLCMENYIYVVGKRMIVGHWHAWRLAENFGEKREQPDNYINCNTWCNEHLIAIDGCSNYPKGGKVNTFVYISNEKPHTLRYCDCK